jgi:hypothetical protein
MMTGNARLQSMVDQHGGAILDVQCGTISTLNLTGAHVWQALELGRDPDVIAAEIARETGQLVEEVVEDLRKFIEALRSNNLYPGQ